MGRLFEMIFDTMLVFMGYGLLYVMFVMSDEYGCFGDWFRFLPLLGMGISGWTYGYGYYGI